MSLTEQHVETAESEPEFRRSLRKDITIVTAILIVVALVAGYAAFAARKGHSSPRVAVSSSGTVVNATLREWRVDLGGRNNVTPGKYTFTIHNSGKIQHELIAFKLSSPTESIPVDKNGDVNEDALNNATDGPNISAGQSQTRVVDLTAPGTYIFMCNLGGHYVNGMHAIVTVTPR
jgi:uncharacterized cupredoxin-like copper-binding protein